MDLKRKGKQQKDGEWGRRNSKRREGKGREWVRKRKVRGLENVCKEERKISGVEKENWE